MLTKMVNEIFFETDELSRLKDEFISSFNSAGKDNSSLLSPALNATFEKISPYLEKRFVKMNSDYCFDKNVTACWLGLCNESFSYMGRWFDSGTKLETVLKEMRGFYKNNKIDIPTKDELLALTELNDAPFPLNRRSPANPSEYILYKTNKIVQGFDTYDSYLRDSSNGRTRPIYRLYQENSKILDNKKIFLLWIAHKLKPVGFKDKFYNALLKLDFVLDDLKIVDISGDFTNIKDSIDSEKLVDKLIVADKLRADLIEYDKKMFFDVNKGSWEVFRRCQAENFENPLKVVLEPPLVARNPKADIVDGIIGIDFGTKSTVVVCSKDKEKILPLRIGMGDWGKKEEAKHYENPTVMEFRNLQSFLKAYQNEEFRPNTSWEDLTISHTAYNNLKNSHSDNFNAYLTELKQWAGDKRRKLKIEDYENSVFELPSLLEMEDDDINPIELYAYYIGLYINNQFNGIYLDYILSFPVTYEMAVREKILESFKKGIQKSLPDIGERIADLRVVIGVSEPAAYAAIALQNYGFDESERVFYAIFDFGGGTTDFDFGIFRVSDANNIKEKRYDYVIEHFGAGGDKFLGGENLLELLAFELFKQNKNLLLEKKISFVLPPECDEFLGSETLLSNSREAKLNMVNLIGKLREFWERDIEDNFDTEIFDGNIEVDLYNNNGEMLPNISLTVDETELFAILKTRIKKGVDSFFESLREAFSNNVGEMDLDVDTINIFLAGNSSKSPLVKELFDDKIKELQDDMQTNNFKGKFELFLPLDNQGDFEKPNGKTGVAFGLIETRPGGNGILVIDKNVKTENIKFQYYLGIKRRRKFKVLLSRELEYNKWVEFIDASQEFFEVYYTSSPLATTNQLPINDSSVKRKRLKIDKVDDELSVYLRLISPSVFEYAVGDGQEFSGAKKIELN